jgi:cation diffusion facilitator family transporter
VTLPPDSSPGKAVSADQSQEKGHGSGRRAVAAAFAANLGIAATKFAAFIITGSASMLAESVHSVADSGNQALLIVGRTRSRRVQTEEHQFGYGSERYIYGFLVAIVVFVVGSLFSIYEGVQRITHPEQLTSPFVAIGVLVVAAVLEGFSLRTAVAESEQARGPRRLLRFIRRSKAPEVPAVLLEDSAALSGLLFALVGVLAAWATHDDRWDGVGSLAIGAVLAFVAVVLAREMGSLLVGESASDEMEHAIVSALVDGDEIERVIHLRTLHLGPETLLVAAKIEVRRDLNAEAIAAGINTAERRCRAAVPIAELIYLEPDVYHESRADLSDPAVRAARRPRLRAPARGATRDQSSTDPLAAQRDGPSTNLASGQGNGPGADPASSQSNGAGPDPASGQASGPGTGPVSGQASGPGTGPASGQASGPGTGPASGQSDQARRDPPAHS